MKEKEKPAVGGDKPTADNNPAAAGDKPAMGERIIKGSFWIIAAIHIAVFTTIGAATGRWRLLVIFLIGFVLTMAVYAGIKIFLARRASKR
jgi:hypothetical protein